jgi:hypothetical protein
MPINPLTDRAYVGTLLSGNFSLGRVKEPEAVLKGHFFRLIRDGFTPTIIIKAARAACKSAAKADSRPPLPHYEDMKKRCLRIVARRKEKDEQHRYEREHEARKAKKEAELNEYINLAYPLRRRNKDKPRKQTLIEQYEHLKRRYYDHATIIKGMQQYLDDEENYLIPTKTEIGCLCRAIKWGPIKPYDERPDDLYGEDERAYHIQ